MTFLTTAIFLIACQPKDNEPSRRNFAQPRGSDICDEIISAYCDRCTETTSWTYDECLERDEIDVDCEATINVGANHEECMDDIEAGSCGDSLPVSCYGVVIVHQ